MAVNNGNLHKLPLKSVLNLNRFENEIDDFKTYRKLNSPMYGGVLSNFYKKEIELAENEKFIMYDKYGKMWTKRYNAETTNTDVYCDNKLIKSFTNETADKEKLEEDYKIIAGNKDYPIYASDYAGEEVSSEFVYSENKLYAYLLVQHWEKFTNKRYIDIYDVSGEEKNLVHSISFTLDSSTVLNTFFTSSAISNEDTTPLLHISFLPYGKTDWDTFFLNKTYKCFVINEDKSLTSGGVQFNYTSNTYMYFRNRTHSVKYNVLGKRSFINNPYYIRNNEEVISSNYETYLKEFFEESFVKKEEHELYDYNNIIVSNGKLYLFPKAQQYNHFGKDYLSGQYLSYVSLSDLSPSITTSSLATYIDFNNTFNYVKLSTFKKNDFIIKAGSYTYGLTSIFTQNNILDYMNGLQSQELYSRIKKAVMSSIGGIDTYIGQVYVAGKEWFLSYNPISGGDIKYLSFKLNNKLGILSLELSELDVTFNLLPNVFSMEIKNGYKPYAVGFSFDEKDTDDVQSWYKGNTQDFVNGISDEYVTFATNGNPLYASATSFKQIITGVITTNFSVDNHYYDIPVPPREDISNKDILYTEDYAKDSKALTSIIDKCWFSSSVNTGKTYETTFVWKNPTNNKYEVKSVSYEVGVTSIVADMSNYKISGTKLGYTFTNGEPFAITRGISNLENQVSRLISFDDVNDTIYYLDYQNKYCCIKAVDVSDCVSHQVVDDFIILKTANYTDSDKLNAIDTEDVSFFPTSLDWNSRNSLMLSDDCGLVFEEGYINKLYNTYLLSVRKREETELDNPEEYQYIVFVSAINAQYLSSENGIGANWCSSSVGVQYLKKIPSVFLDEDTYNNDGYFGFNNSNVTYITNDKNDYAKFFIDNYMSAIIDSLTDATAVYYRFSMPRDNPDFEDMSGEISYPFDGANVLLNVSLFDTIYSSYYTDWFVKVNENIYALQKNGSTLKPVFAYEMLTQGTFNGSFVINGSIYGYTGEYICPISYSDGVISQGDAIINIKGMQFIEATPYQAYFYSSSNRTIYSFTGDNTLTKIFESNRITNIYKAFYNTATQDIWCITNDGILCIQIDMTLFKIENTDFVNIGYVDKYLYLVSEDLENLVLLSYNYDENFEKVPIELETEFYGVDDFTTSETDCVYIRLAIDDDYNDWVGNVEVYSQVLTQDSKSQEKKVFHIEKSMWDKETNTFLIRYQPKYQQGVGFSLGIKSDFPISAIYINSTPLAITNSKNNI